MPTKQPKPTAPYKVLAKLVGPYIPRYSSDSRHMSLSLYITPSKEGFDSEKAEFLLRGHSSQNYGGKGWGDPILWELDFEGSGDGLDLRRAQQAVKHLTAVRRYIEKLPVKPQTIHDLVLVLGKMYRVGQVELIHWSTPDGSREDSFTSINRVAWLAQQAFDNLKPKEVPNATV